MLCSCRWEFFNQVQSGVEVELALESDATPNLTTTGNRGRGSQSWCFFLPWSSFLWKNRKHVRYFLETHGISSASFPCWAAIESFTSLSACLPCAPASVSGGRRGQSPSPDSRLSCLLPYFRNLTRGQWRILCYLTLHKCNHEHRYGPVRCVVKSSIRLHFV